MKLTDEHGKEYELVKTALINTAGAVTCDEAYALKPIKEVEEKHFLVLETSVKSGEILKVIQRQIVANLLSPSIADALAEALRAVVDYVTSEQIRDWAFYENILDEARDAYQGDQ